MTTPPTDGPVAPGTEVAPLGTLSVLGAKGGVGTSVVAANLAYVLSQARPVLLVDADEGRGGLRGLLDIDDPRSIERIYASPANADVALIRGASVALGEHLRALLQPDAFADVASIRPDDVDGVVDRMEEAFDGVVRDEGCHVDRPTLRAVVRARQVLLVVSPDVLCVREARRMVDVLREVDLLTRTIQVIVNDVHGQATLTTSEIETLLGVDVLGSLPNDRRLVRDEKHGGLVSAHAPHSAWSKALARIVLTLTGDEPAATASGGFFARFGG